MIRLAWILTFCAACNFANASGSKPSASESLIAYEKSLPKPTYPLFAERLQLQGSTEVAAFFDSSGILIKTQTIHSSGSDILDTSARDFVEANFHPPAKLVQEFLLARRFLPPHNFVVVPIEYELDRGSRRIHGTSGPPEQAHHLVSSFPPAEETVETAGLSQPPLPELARRYGISGRVVIDVECVYLPWSVSAAEVEAASLVQSSGHDLLDESAHEYALQHWNISNVVLSRHFKLSQIGDVGVPYVLRITVDYPIQK